MLQPSESQRPHTFLPFYLAIMDATPHNEEASDRTLAYERLIDAFHGLGALVNTALRARRGDAEQINAHIGDCETFLRVAEEVSMIFKYTFALMTHKQLSTQIRLRGRSSVRCVQALAA